VTKKIAVIALLSVAAGSLTWAAATPKRNQQLAAKAKAARGKVKAGQAPRLIGTVIYDTGMPGAGFHQGPKNNAGNRFNSDMGAALLMTGQVTMAAIFPNVSGTGFVTIFGPPDGAGNAAVLVSSLVTGMVGNAFNTVTLAPVGVGPDFLAGAWETTVLHQGMDNMSVAPQGFHAFDLNTNFSIGLGTGFAPIAGQNALVRAGGNILVPVELMNFQIQ
jgi:hypothetical protein